LRCDDSNGWGERIARVMAAVLLFPLWGYGERRRERQQADWRMHKEIEAMNAAPTTAQKEIEPYGGWDRCYYD
jgi:hypothetical protein